MRRGRLPYKEGDWFAVPLRDAGWAVGRIARMPPPPKRGITLLGYFFGPPCTHVPSWEEVHNLLPEEAVSTERFHGLGLIEGQWPILGGAGPAWAEQRERWSMPAFGFRDPLFGRHSRREYGDDPRQLSLRQVRITEDEYARLPRDGFSYAGAVEIGLPVLLTAV